jgi:hypothetical protein
VRRAALVLALLAAAPAAPQDPGPRVEVNGGRVTVEADGAPVGAVLRALGEAAGFEVRPMDPPGTFSGRFEALPLDDALQRLLPARSFALRYDEAGRPVLLVVLPAGSAGAPPAPAPPPAPAVSGHSLAQDELWAERRLSSPDLGTRVVAVRRLARLPAARAAVLARRLLPAEQDPVVRAEIAAALGRAEGEGALDLLTALLDDPDAAVRVAAAEALGETDGDAADALGRVLLDGTEPELRQAALTALASRREPAARDYLRRVATRDDPLAGAAQQALAGLPRATPEARVPCLHAAGPRSGCLEQ